MLFFFNPFGLEEKAARVIAVAALMITWWITEAFPMPAVALVPIVLFPLLNIATTNATAAPYGNEVIFLFMGGFMIGLAIEKWNLHKRIALSIVKVTGTIALPDAGHRVFVQFWRRGHHYWYTAQCGLCVIHEQAFWTRDLVF